MRRAAIWRAAIWRAILWTVLVCAVLLAAALPARADCGIAARGAPCEIEGGHYRITTPDGYGPYPAVVYLYGSTGNSRDLIADETFVRAFVRRGYAVIVPAALTIQYVDGPDSGWYLRNERGAQARDDAAFVAAVLTDAMRRHRIDRRRVLIAGMSRGGFLAWDIACHDPGLAAAYAPVAAGYLGNLPASCGDLCGYFTRMAGPTRWCR